MKGFIDFLKAVIASNVFTAISILGPILFIIIWTLLKEIPGVQASGIFTYLL